MKELIEKIKGFEKISSALEPNKENRNQLNKKLNDFTDNFIDEINEVDTFKLGNPNKKNLKINSESTDLESILNVYQKEVVEFGLNPASGGHIGYIPGGGIYSSALGDYLADITNEYAGMHFGSPGAVAVEEATLSWMKNLFGFPENAVGNLSSGGSIANLIALTAARDKHQIKGGKIDSSVIYLSPQVHHCINKAIRIIGLEDIIIRYVKLDEHFRINAEELAKQIELDKIEGLNPFLIVASAGTTDTGAIDPLFKISEIAKKAKAWLHVDAAYGGFFILTEARKDRFKGIEEADSLVIDPHKGLFIPYGLGAVLIKDKEAVFHSQHYTANYMQDATQENSIINPADVSPELTKHFRGLRMWLPLKLHGIEPFVACLEEKILLTQYFRECLKKEGFEIGPEPDLSVSYFWFPFHGDQNEFNKRLMSEIHKDGRIFLSSTDIKGKFVIRMAVLAFRTKTHTIDKAMAMILDAKKIVEASF